MGSSSRSRWWPSCRRNNSKHLCRWSAQSSIDRYPERIQGSSLAMSAWPHPGPLDGGFMTKLVVRSLAVSLDGYAAGPDQSLENPLGVRGPELMQWFFPTRTWRAMQGGEGGETGVDDEIAQQGFAEVGAWILGRNMFGQIGRA